MVEAFFVVSCRQEYFFEPGLGGLFPRFGGTGTMVRPSPRGRESKGKAAAQIMPALAAYLVHSILILVLLGCLQDFLPRLPANPASLFPLPPFRGEERLLQTLHVRIST